MGLTKHPKCALCAIIIVLNQYQSLIRKHFFDDVRYLCRVQRVRYLCRFVYSLFRCRSMQPPWLLLTDGHSIHSDNVRRYMYQMRRGLFQTWPRNQGNRVLLVYPPPL